MSSCLRADVIVVGLGPAGACAAAAAARAGLRVIGVDRKKVAGLPVQCAEFVPGLLHSHIANLAASTRQAINSMTTMIEMGDACLTWMKFDACLRNDAGRGGRGRTRLRQRLRLNGSLRRCATRDLPAPTLLLMERGSSFAIIS